MSTRANLEKELEQTYDEINQLRKRLNELQGQYFETELRQDYELTTTEGDTILPDHLPDECVSGDGNGHGRPLPPNEVLPLDEMEGRYLRWALAHFHGDRSELADRLGMSERTLYRKLRHLHETHH